MFNTIAMLDSEQIKAINDFLRDANLIEFSEKQVGYLGGLPDTDPLNLLDQVACVRGFFADLTDHPALGLSKDKLTAAEELKIFKEDTVEAYFEPEDYKEMVEQFTAQKALELSAYGIILVSCNQPNCDVLFLNSEFKPLYIDHIRF